MVRLLEPFGRQFDVLVTQLPSLPDTVHPAGREVEVNCSNNKVCAVPAKPVANAKASRTALGRHAFVILWNAA